MKEELADSPPSLPISIKRQTSSSHCYLPSAPSLDPEAPNAPSRALVPMQQGDLTPIRNRTYRLLCWRIQKRWKRSFQILAPESVPLQPPPHASLSDGGVGWGWGRHWSLTEDAEREAEGGDLGAARAQGGQTPPGHCSL